MFVNNSVIKVHDAASLLERARKLAQMQHFRILAIINPNKKVPAATSGADTNGADRDETATLFVDEEEEAAAAFSQPTHQANTLTIFRRIYIGSIQFDISEDDLRPIFEEFGPLKSIDMMQDPVNRRHRGYGFVEFVCAEAASLAESKLIGAEIRGRQMKVGRPNNFPSSLPPGVPEPVASRIYVANVAGCVSVDDFRVIMESFGALADCYLSPHPKAIADAATTNSALPQKYAFVEWEEEEAALKALGCLDEFVLAGRPLKVGKCVIGGPIVRAEHEEATHINNTHETPPTPSNKAVAPQTPVRSSASSVPAAVLEAAQEIRHSLLPPNATCSILICNLDDPLAYGGKEGADATPDQNEEEEEEGAEGRKDTELAENKNLTEKQESVPAGHKQQGDADSIEMAKQKLLDEVRTEALKYGQIQSAKLVISHDNVAIQITFGGDGDSLVAAKEQAVAAKSALDWRWFGGRQLRVHYV